MGILRKISDDVKTGLFIKRKFVIKVLVLPLIHGQKQNTVQVKVRVKNLEWKLALTFNKGPALFTSQKMTVKVTC